MSKKNLIPLLITAAVLLVVLPIIAYRAGTRVIPADGVVTSSSDVLPAEDDTSGFTIVDIDSRVMETNTIWWKYGWLLTLRNETDGPLRIGAKIEWIDADGFVVDRDLARNLALAPGEEKVFRGDAMIDSSVAGKVDSIIASVHIQ